MGGGTRWDSREQESWRRWDGESFWAENKEPRGRRARSVGVHVRAVASEALQGLKVTLVSFQTLVLLLKEDNLQSGLSLLIPRPSPLIPSLPLSLPYPGLSAFVINPLYHLCRLYVPHSSTVHQLGIIISAILVLSFSPVSFVLWGLHSGNTDDSSQGPFWSRLSTVSGPNHLGSPL